MKLTENALTVLRARYLARNEEGEIAETPEELFRRVASHVASVEQRYGTSVEEAAKVEEQFYEAMASGKFLPNTPTLVNAGRPLGQLAACFVLPISDCISNELDGIYDTLTNQALIHKSGGGTGFDFSEIRPAGSRVASTTGVASGPVSFMKLYDASTDVVKQGGVRRGANMAILRVDHPDIVRFLKCKSKVGEITNFNISVAVTDAFMKAVENNEYYDLIDPHTKKVTSKFYAKSVWQILYTNAWETGEPGVFFIDEANRKNPVPALGDYKATNPCAEQPLLPYDSCNLGSIDLSKFVNEYGKVDWDGLTDTIKLGVRFLDNVVDANVYPLDSIASLAMRIRRIGLGVMGYADALIKLGAQYDSENGINAGRMLAHHFRVVAHEVSYELGKERGPFPLHNSGARFQWKRYRNCNITTVAPTGSISIIAGCSGGIEPLYAVAFRRKQVGEVMVDVHPEFLRLGKFEEWLSDDLVGRVLAKGSASVPGVPESARKLFRCANEINPEWHLLHQATWQEEIDSSISKTINLISDATPNDVAEVFKTAWKLGLKSVTVYRDGSRPGQVLSTGATGQDNEEAVSCETC